MNKTDNPRCNLCGQREETIEHLFWECNVSSNFILDVEQRIFNRQFVFSKRDIFFGYEILPKHPLNFLIFHIKYYIFQKKLQNDSLIVDEFVYKFKFALEVESHLSTYNRGHFLYSMLKSVFSECKMLFD